MWIRNVMMSKKFVKNNMFDKINVMNSKEYVKNDK